MSRRFENVRAARDWLRRWLVETSLPIWTRYGIDYDKGGFFERLGDDYRAINEPRRTRVVGRQIFCFARASDLGWQGDGLGIVSHGVKFLLDKSLSPSGVAYASVLVDGEIVRADFDLYDQAFALFGIAEAVKLLPERRIELTERGRDLRKRIVSGWKHPKAGFEEARPRRLPLLANPHMHLLEAFLEWMRVDPDDSAWATLADEVAGLAISRLIDPSIGFLRENFDGDWRPHPESLGSIVEPGHQFEWAWLLCRWANGRPEPLDAARRLCRIGEEFGIDPRTDVAVGELNENLTQTRRSTRLWAQCERIKAHIAMAEHARSEFERHEAESRITRAAAALEPFLLANSPGLWRDRMNEDGGFVLENAPASSLYHIVFAACEMNRYAGP